MAVIACGLLASQGLGASFCFRQCIFPVIGNHPLSGTNNAIMVE
jgi:hypothetical protein